MSFNSFEFLVFFPVVVGIYFALGHRWRWVFLLGASYYFYMSWKAEYVLLIASTTGVTYLCALGIDGSRRKAIRKLWLVVCLGFNLGLLFVFKYFNFVSDSVSGVLGGFGVDWEGMRLGFLLPVGISFYTFQAIGYLVDVYRGERGAERHLGVFALFVSFFPQLVAGPIERSTHLLPQFFQKHGFDYERAKSGLLLMGWGLFKKVVVADRLARLVNVVFDQPGECSSLAVALGVVGFTIQIYYDFSAYSDIAIGAGRVMGFELMKNFRRPLAAESITQFWHRWHISLSTWLRDYLYIPLGGNRKGNVRTYVNLLLVMLLGGLWHGAGLNFIFWGGVHGVLLVLERLIGKRSLPFFLPRAGRVLCTFVLVCFSFLFFRADSFGGAWMILGRIAEATGAGGSVAGILGGADLVIVVLSILAIEGIDLAAEKKPVLVWLGGRPMWQRWVSYAALANGILYFGVFEKATFIYFQF